MEKKSLIFVCISFMVFIVCSSFVLANKIGISLTKESFAAGENIAFSVSLYDDQNNLINADVNIIIEDAEKTTKIEKTVLSNKLVDVSLGENAKSGYWKINAKAQDVETSSFFTIEMQEQVKFEIQEDKLFIKNIGNIRYTKTIQIVIGETIGTKDVDLGIGEEVSFRLIAPDGTYNIRVTDGKTTITKQDVALTGKVIGILDEKLVSGEGSITGGLRPGEEGEDFYSVIKNKKFVYVFLLVVIGAAVLLAIERNYRKKI